MQNIKFFIILSFLFFVFIGYQTYEQYKRIKDTQKLIVLNESQSLATFMSAFRQTYQDTFLRHNIEINAKTINLLPVKTTTEISERFSSSLQGDIIIRTVSDRPRNIKNMANKFELEMIDYFKRNPKQGDRFIQRDNIFYYTKPLLIKQSCLKCHGKREDAIPSVRDNYEHAYDYKLNDVRGLLNIQMKEREFFSLLYADFKNTIYSTILLYIILFIVIYILIKKMRKKDAEYTKHLETDIKTKTYEIEKQKDTLETLFEKSSDGILIIDNGKFVQCNEKAVQMLEYESKESLLHIYPSDISPKLQPDGQLSYDKAREMISMATKGARQEYEWLHTKANGEDLLVEVSLTLIILNSKDVVHVVWRDISEKKRAQEKLIEQKDIFDHLAHHDTLTGLPNRILFNDRLEHGVELAKHHERNMALFFIDLDRFKEINDSLGHQTGDRVLKVVTERLKAKIQKDDTLSRLGGDEFTVIVEDFQDIDEVSFLAQKIQTVVTQPIHIDGHTLYISCSVGISLFPQDSTDPNNLIKYADTAMYKAKEEGRDNFQFYSSEMTQLAFERITMESNLRQALQKNEFFVYYQPQIDATSGRLIGMEALIRWRHPTLGLIAPVRFIPLAEETGLIVEIDQWMMSTTIKQICKWYQEGLDPGILALNLSIRQLMSNSFIDLLQETIYSTHFKPEWLELEITESVMMKKQEDAIFKLEQVRNMGIKVAIDDFGTGYSSLAYLKKLPITKLKIDQSFVKGVPDDNDDVSIIKAIIALANSLNLELIAEGVETSVQKEFLLENGCNNIQGYFYDRPISAEVIKRKYL